MVGQSRRQQWPDPCSGPSSSPADPPGLYGACSPDRVCLARLCVRLPGRCGGANRGMWTGGQMPGLLGLVVLCPGLGLAVRAVPSCPGARLRGPGSPPPFGVARQPPEASTSSASALSLARLPQNSVRQSRALLDHLEVTAPASHGSPGGPQDLRTGEPGAPGAGSSWLGPPAGAAR